jgi:hypothetical protein
MPPRVIITWRDAKLCRGTYTKDDIAYLRTATFNALGVLVSKDEQTVVLASEFNDEGQFRDVSLIPTGCIISIRRLVLGSFV